MSHSKQREDDLLALLPLTDEPRTLDYFRKLLSLRLRVGWRSLCSALASI